MAFFMILILILNVLDKNIKVLSYDCPEPFFPRLQQIRGIYLKINNKKNKKQVKLWLK